MMAWLTPVKMVIPKMRVMTFQSNAIEAQQVNATIGE